MGSLLEKEWKYRQDFGLTEAICSCLLTKSLDQEWQHRQADVHCRTPERRCTRRGLQHRLNSGAKDCAGMNSSQ